MKQEATETIKKSVLNELQSLGIAVTTKIEGADTILQNEHLWIDINNSDGRVWFTISAKFEGKDVTALNFEYDLDLTKADEVVTEVTDYLKLLQQGKLCVYVEPYSHLLLFKGIRSGGLIKEESSYRPVTGNDLWEVGAEKLLEQINSGAKIKGRIVPVA